MSEQLYDVTFSFEFKDAISDDCVVFQALSTENVNTLLLKLSLYGEVPEYSFYNLTTSYYITLDKVKDAYLIFSIDYSNVEKYSVEEMVSTLNTTLVEFIREETKVEGFL